MSLSSTPGSCSPRRKAGFVALSLVLWGFVAFTRSRLAPASWSSLAEPEALVIEAYLQLTIAVAALWSSRFRPILAACVAREDLGCALVSVVVLSGAFATWPRWHRLSSALITLALGGVILPIAARTRTLLATSNASEVRIRGAATAGFLLVCGWFRWAEAWRDHYFDAGGWLYLANNFFRLVATAYLVWLHCALGFMGLRIVERGGRVISSNALERLAIAFFTGAAIVHFIMLPLGLSGLFHRWLVCPAASLAIALAPMTPLRAALAGAATQRSFGSRSLVAMAAAAAAGLLLLCKVVYPNTSHDLAAHYFPYYESVMARADVGPNDIWYHYYHTKGSGGVFLAIFLTDMLGAQLASAAYFAASAIVIYVCLRDATGDRDWALLGLAIYVSALAPGVGEFEMQHVVTMAHASGMILLVKTAAARAEIRTINGFLLGAVGASWVLHAPTAVAFFGATLFLLAIAAAIRKEWSLIRSYAIAIAWASSAWLVLAAVSRHQTGMLDIVPFRPFWHHADQEALSRWISPYLMVLLEEGSRPEIGSVLVLDLHGSAHFWAEIFRLDRVPLLCPHPLIFIALVIIAIVATSRSVERRSVTIPLVALGLASLGGNLSSQPASLMRFSLFLLLVTIGLSILAWTHLAQTIARPRSSSLRMIGLAVLAAGSVAWTASQIPPEDLALRWRFAVGRVGYLEAYEASRAWRPSLVPARALAGVLPPGTRVWSFNAADNMAPTLQVESMVSFSMGPRWHEVLFEPPERARAILREQHLDYFLIDAQRPFFEILPHAPLFEPDQLTRWLGVAWSQGDIYLLTWKNETTSSISPEFLKQYRERIDASQKIADWRRLYERLHSIYDANKGKPYPLRRAPDLPPVRGWQ